MSSARFLPREHSRWQPLSLCDGFLREREMVMERLLEVEQLGNEGTAEPHHGWECELLCLPLLYGREYQREGYCQSHSAHPQAMYSLRTRSRIDEHHLQEKKVVGEPKERCCACSQWNGDVKRILRSAWWRGVGVETRLHSSRLGPCSTEKKWRAPAT